MAKKSGWFRVATAGPTVDGRVIEEQWLKDIAETYDTEEYTANIFDNHVSWFGNYGQVDEVKTEKDGKGRLCLFAKITANALLIKLNQAGQKLFTSIRVEPDFADTGKAYLSHLAITDTPASLGTQKLSFSTNSQYAHVFADDEAIELDFNTYTYAELEAEAVKRPGLLERLFIKHSPEEEEMNNELLKKLEGQFAALADKVDKLAGTKQEGVADDAQEDFAKQVAYLEKKVADLETENAEFKQKSADVAEVKKDLDALAKSFADALQDTTPVPGMQTGEHQETEFEIV